MSIPGQSRCAEDVFFKTVHLQVLLREGFALLRVSHIHGLAALRSSNSRSDKVTKYACLNLFISLGVLGFSPPEGGFSGSFLTFIYHTLIFPLLLLLTFVYFSLHFYLCIYSRLCPLKCSFQENHHSTHTFRSPVSRQSRVNLDLLFTITPLSPTLSQLLRGHFADSCSSGVSESPVSKP